MKYSSLLRVFALIFILSLLGSNCKPPPEPPEPPKPKPVPTSVTDIDGNKYNVKRFGNLLWMTENLRVTRYDTESPRSGITLAEATENNTVNKNSPYYINAKDFVDAPYTDNFTNEIRNSLGFLYNWCAASGATKNDIILKDSIQGICPNGWRLPRTGDFNNLYEHLGGAEVAGKKLKAMYAWYPNSCCGTNESGMNCYPAGLAISDTLSSVPLIACIGTQTMFWCAKSYQISIITHSGVLRLLSDQNAASIVNIPKYQANSVRCVMDIDNSFEQ